MNGDNSIPTSPQSETSSRGARLKAAGRWIIVLIKASWFRISPGRRRRICIWGAVVAALLTTIQVYLTFGLTKPMKEHLLPRIESSTGIKVDATGLRADIFGGIRIDGLRIANPAGYSEPDAFYADVVKLDIGFLRLFAGIGEISSLKVRKGKVVIVAAPGGKTNIVELLEKLPKSDMPKLLIGSCKSELLLQYVDHTVSNEAYEIKYSSLLKARDIATYARSAKKQGSFSFTGHMASAPDRFTAALSGTVAPIIDPTRTTFRVEGTVSNIDTKVLEPFAPDSMVQSYPTHLQCTLNCIDGQFQRDSTVKAVLYNIKPTEQGKKRRLVSVSALPSALTVVVQVRGTTEKPEVDLAGSIRRTLLGSASRGVNNLMKATQNALNRFGKATTGRKDPDERD